ncbi:MAG: translation initiation factor IF-2 [Dysgonamonadaceae bacterium]|jgi:translation initiation factor IF-2|nr:translation initiation factor IF-2 [Dysgonamonadaceae bacterium]
MPIRLNKVTRDLNVGLSTVVEFLQKKGFVVDENMDINSKISDEQYELLIAEFNKDVAIKRESTKMSQERHLKEKKESVAAEGYELPKMEEIKTEILNTIKPTFNIIGKIDLPASGKKKKQEKPTPQPVKKEEPKKEESKVAVPEPVKEIAFEEEKIVEKPTIEQIPEQSIVDPTTEQIIEQIVESKPAAEQEDASKSKQKSVEELVPKTTETAIIEDDNEEEKNDDEDEKKADYDNIEDDDKQEVEKEADKPKEPLFRLDVKTLTGPKVLKIIDLSSINQSMRPKKKSKAERRREREAKEKEQKEKAKATQVKKVIQEKDKTTNQNGTVAKTENSESKKVKRPRVHQHPIIIEKGIPPIPGKPRVNGKLVKSNLRKPIKNEVSEEDVQQKVKETLARLQSKTQNKGAKHRREKREKGFDKRTEMQELEMRGSKVIKLTEFVTANDLATMMNVPVTNIISTCMSIGIMVSINQRLDAETINIVADEFGYKTEYVSAEVLEAIPEEDDAIEDLVSRPPIVTVMGHVDHGKTSLLDNIRKTNVIAGEAGGITQHIGAYHVELSDGRRITFLDTPGHEAFTAMRARGASVTDIAIIIIAADDSVMPQTIEAINHATAANVPIVFAINKIDKPGANPEKIKEALSAMNYLVEDWGGKYQSQDISSKQGIGIQELLEKVLLEAEMLDLKANPKRKAIGSVIESSLDKGRGYVVTMLVKNGTLRQGDVILAGTHYGKVKAMFNERNQKIKQAGPAEPVQILGFNGAPTAGDTIHVMEIEQEAREIATKREQLQREQGLRTSVRVTLEDIGRRIAIGGFRQLNIIVKGDVDGSVEALSDSLLRLSTEQIKVKVIHKGVGQISESDIILAAASDAIIIGFQVRPSAQARKQAEKEGVDIRLYSVIYNAIEEVKSAMEGMLAPEIKEEITGNVEILEVFKITKVGSVAGCIVRDGKIKRGNKVRLIRDGIVTYSGELGSLKRFKEDVKEVASGFECGLNIQNFNDIKVGDIVEAFEEIEVKKTL